MCAPYPLSLSLARSLALSPSLSLAPSLSLSLSLTSTPYYVPYCMWYYHSAAVPSASVHRAD